MKRILYTFVLLISIISSSQEIGDYRSVNTGNWNVLSTWQYYNGTSWVTPNGINPQGYPGQFLNTKNVLIQQAHNVTFLSTITTNPFLNLTIRGKLILSSIPSNLIFNIKTSGITVTPNLSPLATIQFNSKGTLQLPQGSFIKVNTGGISGSCTHNQVIAIGTGDLAHCAGAGGSGLLFADLMASGGSITSNPTSNSPVCSGNGINLLGNFTGIPGSNLTFQWTITNPNNITTIINTQNHVIINPIVGTYTIKLKCSTMYGTVPISNEKTILAVVNITPQVDSSNNSIICPNKITPISVTGANSYLWSSNVPNTLFIDVNATIPYTNQNLSNLFIKTSSNTTVTVTGTNLFGCSNSDNTIFTIAPNSTWDGTSWDLTPIGTSSLIFNGNFSSTTDVPGCSCTVNSGVVVINSGHDMNLIGSVTVNGGSLTFENNANLLQAENVTNVGNVTVKRNSSALKRLDYTLWSSPVTGTQSLLSFSPNTLTNRFYIFNTTSNIYSVISSPSTTNFEKANGYLIRVPNNHPTWATIFNGQFIGVPNNGNITKSIVDGGTATTRYNAIGNPYPSTIKIEDFLLQNSSSIQGTIWLWRKSNNDDNPISYSTCTTVGCTVNNGHTYTDDKYISTGQGFLVEAKTGASSVTFTNSMRNSSNVNQFFRTGTTVDRYWIDIKNVANKSFGKNLIAYVDGATNDYDEAKDGIMLNENETAFYSKASATNVVIQARPLFDIADVIPMIFKTNVADNYTISLSTLEGVFNEDMQIYIVDKLLNIEHDLKSSNYTFTSTVGLFEERFELKYQSALTTITFDENNNQLQVVSNENLIKIKSAEVIESVTLFDLMGRKLSNKNDVNSNNFEIFSNTKNQVIIVQVKTKDNIIYNRKIIL